MPSAGRRSHAETGAVYLQAPSKQEKLPRGSSPSLCFLMRTKFKLKKMCTIDKWTESWIAAWWAGGTTPGLFFFLILNYVSQSVSPVKLIPWKQKSNQGKYEWGVWPSSVSKVVILGFSWGYKSTFQIIKLTRRKWIRKIFIYLFFSLFFFFVAARKFTANTLSAQRQTIVRTRRDP